MISHSSPSTQEFCRVSFCGIKCFCSNIYHFVGEFISFLIWILDDLPTKHFCSVDVSYVSADRCVVIYFKELHFDIASPWLPTPLRWNYFVAICCWFISFHIGRPAADNRPQRCCLCDVLGHSLQEWQLDHTFTWQASKPTAVLWKALKEKCLTEINKLTILNLYFAIEFTRVQPIHVSRWYSK